MLVLSRRRGESIVIGNDVVVSVLEVRGGQVRLGVDAPRHLQVHREEVYVAVSEANVAAVAAAAAVSAELIKTTVRDALPEGQDLAETRAEGTDGIETRPSLS